jgi:hypothetical protein
MVSKSFGKPADQQKRYRTPAGELLMMSAEMLRKSMKMPFKSKEGVQPTPLERELGNS